MDENSSDISFVEQELMELKYILNVKNSSL